MSAKRLNLTFEQGSDYGTPFQLLTQGGVPVNLTGARAAMMIRTSVSDPTSLLTLSTDDGSLIIDAWLGTILPVIDDDIIFAFLRGVYVYDLILLETNGRTSRPFEGTITVCPVVTIYPFPAPSPSPSPAPAPAPSPSPAPAPSPSPTPSPSAFLMEDSGYILQEDGSKILTES